MKRTLATAVAGLLVVGGSLPALAAKDPKLAQCKALRKEKWAAKARELATAADSDKNGSLSEQEFDPLRAAAKKAQKELEAACEAACGIAKEKKPAAPKVEKPPKAPKTPDPAKEKARAEKEAAKIKPWDTDADGKLSDAEKKAKQVAEDKADLAKDFKKADDDGDGKLSIDEAVKAIR